MTSSRKDRNIRAEAQRLIDLGMRVVVVAPNGKRAVAKAWQNARPGAKDFSPNDNIGVLVGERSGFLVDLDFDIPEARELSSLPCFFEHFPSFRRSSLPAKAPGHRLAVSWDAPNERVVFGFSAKAEMRAIEHLGIAKTVVLEVRAGKVYTVFPPSILDDDPLVYDQELSNIPEMAWGELRRRAGLLAFCAFMLVCYPDEGSRDEFCFLLAGTMAQAGVPADVGEEIMEAIATIKGDDVEERVGKATAAAARLAEGKPVAGLSALLEFLELSALEKRLREWLQLPDGPKTPASGAVGSPPAGAIDVGNPNIVERTRQIEEGLIEATLLIFRRDERLVHPLKLEADEIVEGVRYPKNLMRLRPATHEWLAYQASAYLRFVRRTAKAWQTIQPKPEIMRPLLVAIEDRKFPSIDGLVMTPTLARNEPGYDPASKLYLAFEPGVFSDIPLEPSKDEALAALNRLMAPAQQFPFATDEARAVWLGAMLTAPIRGMLRTCPVFAFDAPAAGSGKTKLAQMAGMLGLGVLPPAASWGANDEENSKALFSILRNGDPIVLFDNVEADIANPDLCRVLTAPTITGRILGVSEMATLGTKTLFMFTGNNLQISGDMTRRALICRIDTGEEHPEDREFDFDPVKYVEENRIQLVSDALTVTRAYHAAGRPEKLAPFNSFEEWDLVRGALVWLGESDPIRVLHGLRDGDAKREEKAELFIILLKKFKLNFEFRSRDLDEAGDVEARRAIVRLTERNEFNTSSVGKLLSRHKDQPHMGVILKTRMGGDKLRIWWLDGRPEQPLLEAANMTEYDLLDEDPM